MVRLREAIEEYERRHKVRLTYAELAKKTGLSRATIETVASRKAYNTTLATIDKLCAALGCDLTDLLSFEPRK